MEEIQWDIIFSGAPLKIIVTSPNRRSPGALFGPGAGVGGCPARCPYPCCSTEDVAMRTYDFSPLWRSTVGFDRLFDQINNTQQLLDDQDGYPPYDIVRTGEESFRISVALAGFNPNDITI